MKLEDIPLRDPFILYEAGRYYLYGTFTGGRRSDPLSFLTFLSEDLTDWSDPVTVFIKPDDFWADRDNWAPEVHKYKGCFYMFASFRSEKRCRGTQILKSDSPLGPFSLHGDLPVTPPDWDSLDGTLYIDPDGVPYIVFCHEWTQVKNGKICALRLSDDLSRAIGEPFLLFSASEPAWAKKDGDTVTDGPFLFRARNGSLLMLWSSFKDGKYCEALARSVDGTLCGKWIHEPIPFFENDGGHGMLFRTGEGELKFVFHQPNRKPFERPRILDTVEDGNTILIRK